MPTKAISRRTKSFHRMNDRVLATVSIGSLVCMALFTVLGSAKGTIVCNGLTSCKTGKCCTLISMQYAAAPSEIYMADVKTYQCAQYWALKCKFPYGGCGGFAAEPAESCPGS